MHPVGEPPHPLLLGAGLDRGRVVLTPDPIHGGVRRLAGEHGHAGKDGAGASEATHASHLDHVAAARPRERRHDLICRSVAVGREPVVRPLDHLGRPGRQPAHVEIQPERSRRIVLDPVADRRCPNNCAIRKHDIHPLSLGVGAAAGCAPCGVTRLSRLCPERQMSFTTTAKWRVPNEPSPGSYAARHHSPSASPPGQPTRPHPGCRRRQWSAAEPLAPERGAPP